MKRVTASDARKNWFRILDEVAAGEVVVIDRGGRRILITRETSAVHEQAAPSYGDLIRGPHADRADRWGWSWEESDGEIKPLDLGDRQVGEET